MEEPRQRSQAGEPPAVGQSRHRRLSLARHGKGKTPNALGEASAARPPARRTPTNANKLDRGIERVVGLRMAQEAIRLEIISKLEMLQRSVTDVPAFVIKINEKQSLQDVEMTFLRQRLEALQTQLKETSLEKRKAKISPYVLEQLRREAKIRQPVPQKRVKAAVSKRPTYLDSEDEEPIEEILPQGEGPKEPSVALKLNSGTNFTIPNPPSLTQILLHQLQRKLFHPRHRQNQ
ncbi:hypothetical protein ACLOJK_019165 [Asimina triloba]